MSILKDLVSYNDLTAPYKLRIKYKYTIAIKLLVHTPSPLYPFINACHNEQIDSNILKHL